VGEIGGEGVDRGADVFCHGCGMGARCSWCLYLYARALLMWVMKFLGASLGNVVT